MTARDYFGLGLRLGALWIMAWGFWQLAAALVYLPATLGSFINQTPLTYGSITYGTYGAPAVIFSVLVLRFAESIVNFTYRQR